VEAVRGIFEDPAYVAFREPSPPQPLYTVRFAINEVWGAVQSAATTGISCQDKEALPPFSPADTIGVDVFQPWLEPVENPAAIASAATPNIDDSDGGNEPQGSTCGQAHSAHAHAHAHGDASPSAEGHAHTHDGHAHAHGDDPAGAAGHAHLPRAEVEMRAVEAEGEEPPLQALADALLAALERRGVVTRAALRAAVDALDTARERGYGATLVARAWVDPAFKARLLADAAAAATELGIQTSNYAAAAAVGDVSFHPAQPRRHGPGETVLRVVENTAAVHNLVVCTLCSCYPVAVLGLSPDWYKSRAYRARAVREPRALLREFGVELSPAAAVRVHDSTAEVPRPAPPVALAPHPPRRAPRAPSESFRPGPCRPPHRVAARAPSPPPPPQNGGAMPRLRLPRDLPRRGRRGGGRR
jgi:nitrile hydratase